MQLPLRSYFMTGPGPILLAHALLTLVFAILGSLEIVPNLISKAGYAHFASDGFSCHIEAIELKKHLLHGEWSQWFQAHSRFHTRLASIAYSLWGWLFGHNILSYWPINALALFASWKAWGTIIKEFTGQTPQSSWLWLLFPSILVHYTQLIRDPLYICFFLWWIATWVYLFKSPEASQWRRALIIIAVISPFLYASRSRFWVLCQVMSLCWLIISLALCFSKKRPWIFCLSVFILFTGINAHTAKKMIWEKSMDPMQTSLENEGSLQSKPFQYFYKIASLRDGFLKSYQHAPSIDSSTQFKSDREVIAYLPRATQIGFLYPFPSMWFNPKGKTGWPGRLTSIFESSIMFFIMIFILWNLRQRPFHLHRVILLSTITITFIALGLVVTNGGALYRMRYASWILCLALFCIFKQQKAKLT